MTTSPVRGHPADATAEEAPLVRAAGRPVLLVNPRSGDGKADRVGLVDACRARGIDVVVHQPGAELRELAEEAVAGGADVIGMAGGDGSLGIVAEVAARCGVAMVVVPAGTWNHFAMDLGLDRTRVVDALDAFAAARERIVDLGEVNGRVFVNNVSLGLYAQIIRSPDYRAAKVETTLAELVHLLGPGSRPFDLRFTGPAGERHTSAHVLQVANNAYGRAPGALTSRPRLDGGRLGVVALELLDPQAVAAFRSAARRDGAIPGLLAWETSSLVVDSTGPVDAGVDGEAVGLAAPLRFSIRPAALRVRLPEHASGLSPAARLARARDLLRPVPRRNAAP